MTRLTPIVGSRWKSDRRKSQKGRKSQRENEDQEGRIEMRQKRDGQKASALSSRLFGRHPSHLDIVPSCHHLVLITPPSSAQSICAVCLSATDAPRYMVHPSLPRTTCARDRLGAMSRSLHPYFVISSTRDSRP